LSVPALLVLVAVAMLLFSGFVNSEPTHSNDPDADVGVIHAFPEDRTVCTSFDTICYTRI
jgi:hypothetical protein